MGNKLFLILTVLTIFVRPAYGIENDKVAHMGVSHIITSASYGIGKAVGIEDRAFNLFMAVGLASMVAVSKELSDKKFDSNDLLYDGIGIGSGVLFIYSFDF